MSDLQGRITAGQTSETNFNKGPHYNLITGNIDPVFKSASLIRAWELSATRLGHQDWYTSASSAQHSMLQDANINLWTSQNNVDRLLEELQGIYEFAEPLLSAALKEQYGVDDDVKTTYLHLYIPKDRPWYVIDISGGVITRTVSLLDAALHNFGAYETCEAGSDFISKPDERGLFDIKPIKRKMTIAQFQKLCRELDIGARYTEHLESILLDGDAVAKAFLEYKVTASQKAAFKAAAHLALMTKDITRDSQELILAMLDGQRNLTLKGKVVQFAELSVMDAALTGIVLITPDLERSRNVEGLIAYVPNDPEHPLKEYASVTDFLNELTRQLRDNAFIESTQMTYRQYFSQFVDQQQRGHFFAGLQQRLFRVQWHKKEDLDQRPTWREEPVTNPKLQFSVAPITGDFWGHLYQQKLNKILNDARDIAVSTADTDSNARWAWWDNFKKIVSDIFNVVLMVVTPFVPGLGELMMAYTAYQIANDVIESIVDLAEGLGVEAAEHFVGVVTDIVQLAAFAAGAQLGQMARLKLSPFVDGLKPVVLPDGQSRLWNPGLKPYEQPNLKLPENSKPNEFGLHRYGGQDILPLDGKHYAVKKDSVTGKFQIEHPARSDAYRPELNTNGVGAWRHELEQPRTWEGPELMRRLGHSVSEFSDTELAQIRRVSDTSEDVLRKMHVESEPPAPMLADTISRFDAYKQVEEFIADMQSDSSTVSAKDHSIDQLHVMTRYGKWPDTVSIRVIDAQAKTTWRYVSPKSVQGDIRTVQIHDAQLRSGELLKTLLEALDENETNTLLEQKPGTLRGTLDERIAKLRENIAKVAESRKAPLFNDVYKAKVNISDPRANLIKLRFPSVPMDVIEGLLADASSAERQQMAKWDFADSQQTKPIPLGLAEALRLAQREARLTRAYEGLYLDALINPDTEKLLLNTLKKLPGWSSDLRIEVREGAFSGELRASVGAEGAESRKVLVHNNDGRYETRDQNDLELHEADDLFCALQHALPDTHRTALGLPDVGQGAELKTLIEQHLLSREELRSVLKMQPIKPWFKAPKHRANGRLGYPLSGRGAGVDRRLATDEGRVLKLFPDYTDAQVDGFLEQVGTQREKYLVNFEAELQGLRNELQQWTSTPSTRVLPDGSVVAVERYEKQVVAQLLEHCWQRRQWTMQKENGHEIGYELNLQGRTVGELPALTGYFSHVRFLDLSKLGLTEAPNEFLDSFPSIEQLKLQHNGLRDFPTEAAEIPSLIYLDVSNNNITLTDQTAGTLAKMNHLEYLQLSHNPLAHLPDFSQMTALIDVRLQATGISEWPVGLRDQADLAMIDLRDNQLTSFPAWAVNPSSEQATNINKVLTITELNGNPLSDQGMQQYADILTRIYLDNDQAGLMPVPPDGPDERGAQGGTLASSAQRIDRWLRDIPRNELGARKAQWELLDRDASGGEANRAVSESEEFFRLLEKLSDTAEYKKAYPDLKNRVWAVLDAAEENEVLRRELFKAAGEPETCSDRAALVFSGLEIKVQIHKALALVGDKGAGHVLLELAKGLFRLDELETFALKDIKERIQVIVGSDISVGEKGRQLLLMDQIEVRLSYRVNLRDRLDLPGQPTQAEYTGLQYVPRAKLRAAEQYVKSLKDSKAEIESIARRDFWGEYLKDKYRSRFELAYESIYERMERLEITRETMTSDAYNSQSKALATEFGVAERKLIDLLTPQEILDLEDVDSAV